MSDLPLREPCTPDRLKELENRASEIRKLVFGALLLAKEMGKEQLERYSESELMNTLREAEESFPDNTIPNPIDRLEDVMRVIQQRARALFLLLDSISKQAQKSR